VVFDRHIAESPDPGTAANLWSFAHPHRTRLSTLAEALHQLGPEPWRLVVACDHLTPPWTIPQDVFEAYIEDEEDATDDSDREPITPWTDPPIGWFDRDDAASWEYLHSSVAAALTTFDAEFGQALDLLRDRGFDRTAAWVFTAARGYPLGEHGMLGPFRPWLHEELVHLPLIVRLPGGAQAGRRISALTQPADVAAWPGGGLASLLDGSVDSLRTRAVSRWQVHGAAEWAVRTADWAYLWPRYQPPEDEPRAPQLYRKPDDYWEVNDVALQHPDVVEELDQALRSDMT
jgi:hypothetical protein